MTVIAMVVAGIAYAAFTGYEARRTGGLITRRPYNDVHDDTPGARSSAPLPD